MASCLGAAFSTVASVFTTGYNNYDGVGAFLGLFFGVRSNTVGQKFSRRWSAIDYKVQRQQLHREDIRDLIELTTARVDIYHIVGTLLLAFCMAWFTDAALAASDFPAWFIDLYFISNFAAIGFLLMCVLLGMYAAIAAKSIGTRLLTSYARISFPTNDEIDEIKVPIFFNAGDVIRKHRERIDERHEKIRTRTHSLERSRSLAADRLEERRARRREVLSDDDEQHFRRFLEELPRWLVYDIWSRACMTFGLNSMLQAMSYFTLGLIWNRAPLSAIMSFFAVRTLSMIILFMDINDALDWFSWHWYFVVFRSLISPVLSISLLAYQTFFENIYDTGSRFDTSSILVSSLVMVVFASQAFWTWYMVFEFKVAPRPMDKARRDEELPESAKTGVLGNYRFAPTQFAHVLEWVRSREEIDDMSHNLVSGSGFSDISEYDISRHDTRTFNEDESHHKSKRHDVNGGKPPGVWKCDTRHDSEPWRQDLDESDHTDWLPFRTVQRFTWVVVTWWVLSSLVHALVITSLTGNDFTGSDQMTSNFTILERQIFFNSKHAEIGASAIVRWPEPAKLFKVAALHCGGSRMWVSNNFTVYALTQESSVATASLELVRDGAVGTIFCDDHGCDALSPPSPQAAALGKPWIMSRLESLSAESKISNLAWYHLKRMVATMPGTHQDESAELPASWRLVTGAWAECRRTSLAASCKSATLAGWDGRSVFVGTLQKDFASDIWTFHTRIEADPVLGLGPKVKGSRSYADVKALQLGANGHVLTVLLGAGIIDVWDLDAGEMVERVMLSKRYTSMCQHNQDILLSRQTDTGPVLVKFPMPHNVSKLFSRASAPVKFGDVSKEFDKARTHSLKLHSLGKNRQKSERSRGVNLRRQHLTLNAHSE